MRGRIREQEIEAEAIAQIRRIQSGGVTVSHIDSHKHIHAFPRALAPLLRAAQHCRVNCVRNPFEPSWSLRATRVANTWRRAQVHAMRSQRRAFQADRRTRNVDRRRVDWGSGYREPRWARASIYASRHAEWDVGAGLPSRVSRPCAGTGAHPAGGLARYGTQRSARSHSRGTQEGPGIVVH